MKLLIPHVMMKDLFSFNYDETFSMCGFHIFADNYETEKNLDKMFPKLFLFFER